MRGLEKIESLLRGESSEQHSEYLEQIRDVTKLSEKLREIEKKIYYRETQYVDEFEKWNQIIEDLARLCN